MNNDNPALSLELAFITANISLRIYGAFCLEHGILTDASFRLLVTAILKQKPAFSACHQALVQGHFLFRGIN